MSLCRGDLKQTAHAEAGQLPLDCASLDLVELCTSQVKQFQAQADVQQITHSLLTVTEPLPPIHGDGQRLEQVLNNLLSNALRHTPPYGTVEVAPVTVVDGLQITVTNPGEGITPDELLHFCSITCHRRTHLSMDEQFRGSEG